MDNPKTNSQTQALSSNSQQIKWTDAEVIHKEESWYGRKFEESAYITSNDVSIHARIEIRNVWKPSTCGIDVNRNELLVELVDRDNGYAFAQYAEFRIGSEPDGYPLERLSGYTGDAGDSLKLHLGMKFTTKDVDQDLYDDHSCAEFGSGAYWYHNCFESNLNGELINHEVLPAREREGMIWGSFRSRSYVLGKARMLVRPFASR